MDTNKEKVYYVLQKNLLSGDHPSGMTASEVGDKINLHRSNASKLLNELVREGKLKKNNRRPVKFSLDDKLDREDSSIFSKLIGYERSLEDVIELAKAAVLYPQGSLNMIIRSNSGTGRSSLVSKIYEYAVRKEILSENNNIITINCLNYENDYERLRNYMFSQKNKELDALINELDGGILYINHAEFLNSKDLEKLIQYIDLKKEKRNIFLIIGVKKKNKNIFEKIPITIELPDYHERPLIERFKLINKFFHLEAINSSRIIEVDSDVLKVLMISHYNHNIKQLENEIKNATAKAYLRVINKDNYILVKTSDLNLVTRKNLIHVKSSQNELDFILENKEKIYYDPKDGYINADQIVHDQKKYGPYESMNKQYHELTTRGFNDENIDTVLNSYIDNLFNEFNYSSENENQHDLSNLSTIVDKKVIELVKDFMNKCITKLNREYDSSIFFGLCLHIHSLVDFNLSEKRVSNEQITTIIQDYPMEYALSAELATKIQSEFNINIPIDEITIITMFIIKNTNTTPKKEAVLLYIMHGDGVASSLMKVTNQLTQLKNSYAYDLKLNKNPQEALIEIEELMKKIDQGEGIIIIYDMGSIKAIIETIIRRNDIQARLIQIPISLIGLEIARKSSLSNNIDYIYNNAVRNINKYFNIDNNKNSIIITLCHTSEGGALQMKQYIERYSRLEDEVVALPTSNLERLTTKILELREDYNIRVLVGTRNPELLGIPFISFGEIFEHSPKELDNLLTFSPIIENFPKYNEIYNTFEENFKYTPIKKLKRVLPELIETFYEYYELTEDESIGLFVHVGSLIERILAADRSLDKEFIDMDKIINNHRKDYKYISKELRRIEEEFNIIINDYDIAMLIIILKRL